MECLINIKAGLYSPCTSQSNTISIISLDFAGGGGGILEAVFHSHRGVLRVTTPAISEHFLNSQKGFSLVLVLLYHTGMMEKSCVIATFSKFLILIQVVH